MPWFEGSRGDVHHDSWLPAGEVRSVVVFLHGFGEHLGLYDAFARRLTADGHAVHALDCVGHGRSDGERGLITWDAYAEDALTLVGIAARRHPGVPQAFGVPLALVAQRVVFGGDHQGRWQAGVTLREQR